jgi:Arc/MetJ-type ribon-helix-helix transcriptional regulator
MPELERTSVTLRPDQLEQIEELAENDDARYVNKSEVIRFLIDRGFEAEEIEQDLERVKNEKQVLVEEIQDGPDEDAMVPKEETEELDSMIDRLKWIISG